MRGLRPCRVFSKSIWVVSTAVRPLFELFIRCEGAAVHSVRSLSSVIYCEEILTFQVGAHAWERQHGIITYDLIRAGALSVPVVGSGWIVGSFTKETGREVMMNRDGWGHSYFDVRGEIHGPSEDDQQRKRLPRTFPLIKNESQGSKED